MTLDEAVKLVSNIVKTSTSLDSFKHIDLTLAPASEQDKYIEALVIIRENITRGVLTPEKLNSILFN